ncbi:hypothetical protein ABPG72_014143 [Tetrahymena utriculariae]
MAIYCHRYGLKRQMISKTAYKSVENFQLRIFLAAFNLMNNRLEIAQQQFQLKEIINILFQFDQASQWADLSLGFSIRLTNITFYYSPEIKAFQYEYFRNYVNSSQQYQRIDFSNEWAIQVMQKNQNAAENFTQELSDNSLLNRNNLQFLFQSGYNYDQSKNDLYLSIISERFLINKQYFGDYFLDATYLFWEYAKYMVNILAEFKNIKNGGINVFKQSLISGKLLSENFEKTYDYLAITIIEALMFNQFNLYQVNDCVSFTNLIKYVNPQSDNFCNYDSFKNFNMNTMKVIYECNLYQHFSDCSYLQRNLVFEVQMIQFIIQSTDQIMFNQYQCSSPVIRCSYYEIAAKQWYNLEIIRNFPQAAIPYLPEGRQSIAQWISGVKTYELGYFFENYGYIFSQPPQILTQSQISYLLGYNILFSNLRLKQLLLFDDNFYQNYFFQESQQIRFYLIWIQMNNGDDRDLISMKDSQISKIDQAA